MASRKDISRSERLVITNGVAPPPIRASRLHPYLRFPLLAIISLSLNVFLLSVSSNVLGLELGRVSRSLNEPWQPAAYLGWKVFELGVEWYLNYDDLDITSLTLLVQAPQLYLLLTYYTIPRSALALRLAIEVASVALPTKLLRPRSVIHNPNAPSAAVPNRILINSFQVMASCTVLAAGSYALAIYAASYFGLPTFIVQHFEVVTVANAHESTIFSLAILFIPVGWAAQMFLLTPSWGAQTKLGDAAASAFNPTTASLGETVKHNVWGWSKRTKALAKQTAVVLVMVYVNTVHKVSTLEGTDPIGAVGYAGIWVAANVLVAAMFEWVGKV
ncbi:hypothetical protein K432DRAFT_335209 [Lepidopterella palustris CBS 459.81]|uniref:Uncharacterized protein n=1 Tax=Lepidopterella palustris CBS 459.81 TaxID=1314670 RepID=A0A8E2E3N0_9PEZI|nr:hypothetical protein K432DRAFT_335209 [Lepidopterella palustris CBS 459.81]